MERVESVLTVPAHAELEALLQAAVLAPVPVHPVHHALLVARALVVHHWKTTKKISMVIFRVLEDAAPLSFLSITVWNKYEFPCLGLTVYCWQIWPILLLTIRIQPYTNQIQSFKLRIQTFTKQVQSLKIYFSIFLWYHKKFKRNVSYISIFRLINLKESLIMHVKIIKVKLKNK